MNQGLIRRKLLRPQPPDRLVGRARLDDLIARKIVTARVVLVTGTAGSGKTTAVASALSCVDAPIAWLTLDDTDTAPGRLLSYLEAAIAAVVPEAQGVSSRALAAGIHHAEAAGLLAEAVGSTDVVLVIDEMERLGNARDALDVIDSLVRYAPPGLRLVLNSRRGIQLRMTPRLAPGLVEHVGEIELAFTVDETTEAFAVMPTQAEPIDAEEAIAATGGWVTGILFQAWRAADHVPGGGGPEPLDGYLSTQILDDLPESARAFLIRTSLLDVVTADRAEALGIGDASATLAFLREQHLPASWDSGGAAIRCHPCFRDHLRQQLTREGRSRVEELRRACGALLEDENLFEEATEEYLKAGALADAARSAERAIWGVLERLDFAVAERWLDELRDQDPATPTPLTTAELMLAVGREDYRRGALVADRLAATGTRDQLAHESPRAAAMMAWCYFHQCRLDELEAVIAAASPGAELIPVQYLMTLVDEREPPPLTELDGGPLDGLLVRLHYWRGRFAELSSEIESRWGDAVVTPWRIAALRATGETERALALYEEARSRGWAAVGLHAVVAGELFIDLNRPEDARAALYRGRAEARRGGSLVWEMFSLMTEAKVHLRLLNDAVAGKALLDDLERLGASRRYHSTAEQLDTWYGLALLRLGDDEGARERLRAAVASMTRADRILELPTAAVYLAEAEWRTADEAAADAAADLALEAARRQGTNHILLQALADFPAVLSRRLDAEPEPDSPWHSLGRALLSADAVTGRRGQVNVRLTEFGSVALEVNGEEVRPRIFKTYELVALLATCAGQRLERSRALEILFDGRADPSSRAYLRQTVHHLRLILPEGAGLSIQGTDLVLDPHVGITSQSVEFESILGQASRQHGDQKLKLLLQALACCDEVEYLPRAQTEWARERRDTLERLANDARFEAAVLAHELELHCDAEKLVERLLTSDPYRESAWRLAMRVAASLGADDQVIESFRGCESALAEIGVAPSSGTRRLLDQLRR